ncbi:hypothetical protein ACFWIJ_34245 [Streptomyces sp. NPDC127079]|uniref:hypothetical protein n=1 Tax=Streptomyces sp. NPDC127079 TaxID=3347132 RepID=UPI0036602C41
MPSAHNAVNDPGTSRTPSGLRKIVAASLIGTTIERYDTITGLLTAEDEPGGDATARFVVYGLAATVADRTRQGHSDGQLRAELTAAAAPWQLYRQVGSA